MSDLDPRAELLRVERENSDLRHEILALRRFIDSMQNLVDALDGPHTDVEIITLLSGVLDNALETINASDGSLLAVDEETAELVFVLAKGKVPLEQLAWKRIPPNTGIAGWVAHNRQATIVNDVAKDQRFYAEVDREVDFHTNSILAAPLVAGPRVLGVIEVLNKRDGKLFNEEDLILLSLICRFAGELLDGVVRRGAPAPAGGD